MIRASQTGSALALLFLSSALVSCGGNDAVLGDFVANSAPQTHVESTPPVPGQTSFTVEFFWSGDDNDGRVVAFEWRISNNGVDQVIDVEDTLEANLPWNYTVASDSLFLVSADLPGYGDDVNDPRISVANRRFWQSHTFFVRAIDDKGLRDPTPAHVSFTATTLSPKVEINLPGYIPSNSCGDGPLALRFGWEGTDPDNPEGKPAFARYLLLEYGGPSTTCVIQNNFNQNNLVAAAPDSLWSRWIKYDAPQDSGITVTFPRFPESKSGTSYFFAVQVRDIAGAVTPTFEWGRNVRHLRITKDKFPVLTVTERFLGTDDFVSINKRKAFEIVSEQDVQFSWSADAAPYGGLIEAYRYGFQVVDPEDQNDRGWSVPWGIGPSWQRTPPVRFSQGSPNFVVQVRDNSGALSRATYQFQVIQVANREDQRPVLLVDDFEFGTTPTEVLLEQRWDTAWRDLLLPVSKFESSDVIDSRTDVARLNFATINQYRAVIWFGYNNASSFMRTRLAPRSRLAPQFNWLEAYQNFVGNLFLVGPGPLMASIEDNTFLYPVVFNIADGGNGGFGTRVAPDGSRINVGTERWPYTGWCLETIDLVRPVFGFVFGEGGGVPLRTQECAAIVRAFVSPAFDYEDARAEVIDLVPMTLRALQGQQSDPTWSIYRPGAEEFYNRNVTRREIPLILRDCQKPMFTMVARRDVDDAAVMATAKNPLPPDPPLVINEANCPSARAGRSTSPLTGATVAVASFAYSSAKQRGTLQTQDFLWGFHPHSFERAGVRAAVNWMLLKHWGLNED